MTSHEGNNNNLWHGRHGWYINWSGELPYVITKLKTDQTMIWRCIFIHHLILGSSSRVDHIDGNPLNNQKLNLRPATWQQNNFNTRKRMTLRGGRVPSSVYKGVCRRESKRLGTVWYVIIKLSMKGEKPVRMLRRGPFLSEIEAAKVYNKEVFKIRGDFAYLNEIPAPPTRIEGGGSNA